MTMRMLEGERKDRFFWEGRKWKKEEGEGGGGG